MSNICVYVDINSPDNNIHTYISHNFAKLRIDNVFLSTYIPFINAVLAFKCILASACVCLVSSHVQVFVTYWTVARLVPLSMGFLLMARILKFVAISYARGCSWPSDQTEVSWVSCIAGGFFTSWATGEALCLDISV